MAGVNRFSHRPGLLPGVASACAYDASGLEPGEHRGLPSPWLTFVVSTDGPVRTYGTVEDTGSPDPSRVASYDVLLAGLHPVAARVEQPERQSGVQLALHPLAARRLLGCTAAELTGVGQDGADVVGPAVLDLHERVSGVRAEERLAVMDDWLRSRLAGSEEQGRVRPEVARAWRVLHASRGRSLVDAVAREVGLSPRHLRDLVRAELGTTPKGLARALRFDHVVERLAAGERRLASLAATTGYADQAHLTREFTTMAGCSPTAWLVEERRNLQDGGHRNRPASDA